MEPVEPFLATSASGEDLGPAQRIRFAPATPRRTAEQRMAGLELPAASRVALPPTAAPPEHTGEPKGSPSRRDRGVDVAAQNADFDQLGADDLDSTPELGVFEAPNEYAVQSYEEIGINDCMADPAPTAPTRHRPTNHLFLCSGDKLTAVRYRCFLGVFCSPIAWVGRATEPGRSVSVVSLMDNFVFGGDVAQILPVQLRLSMTCTPGAGLGTVCEQHNPLGSTNSIATRSSSTIGTPFTFTAPTGDAFGDDGLSFYDFSTTVSMVGSNSATFGAGEFRCDYGRGLSLVSGCVFPTATETFSRLSATDPTHAQAADHILTALYQPSLTMPPGENKVIPGAPGGLYPLTRAVDQRTPSAGTGFGRGARACVTTPTTSGTGASSAWTRRVSVRVHAPGCCVRG